MKKRFDVLLDNQNVISAIGESCSQEFDESLIIENKDGEIIARFHKNKWVYVLVHKLT